MPDIDAAITLPSAILTPFDIGCSNSEKLQIQSSIRGSLASGFAQDAKDIKAKTARRNFFTVGKL
jgi:hypothetical protein